MEILKCTSSKLYLVTVKSITGYYCHTLLSIPRSTNPSSTSGGSAAPSSWASSTTTAWWSRPSFSAPSSPSSPSGSTRTAAPARWTRRSTCSASAWCAPCWTPAASTLTGAPARGSWTVSSSTSRHVCSSCASSPCL